MGCLKSSPSSNILVAQEIKCGAFVVRKVSHAYLYQLLAHDLGAPPAKHVTEVLDFRGSAEHRLLGFHESVSKELAAALDRMEAFQVKVLYDFKTLVLLFDSWDS
jgi:hypothetical protein